MFKGWKVVAVIGGLLLVLLGVYLYSANQKQLQQARVNEAVTKVVDTINADGAAKGVQSAAIDEKVVTDVTVATQAAEKQHDVIAERVKEKVAKIEQDYATQTPSPIVSKEKTDAISAARIDGLWDSYCAAVADPTVKCP